MRFRKILIVGGFLITWSFVTYYFLLRNIKEIPINNLQQQHQHQHQKQEQQQHQLQQDQQVLQRLEHEVTQLLNTGDTLMEHFLAFLKLKYSNQQQKQEQQQQQQQSQQQQKQQHPQGNHNNQNHITTVKHIMAALPSPPTLNLVQVSPIEEPERLQSDNLNSADSHVVQQFTTLTKVKKTNSSHAVQTYLDNGQAVIPILVLACNRVSVTQCLDNLIQYRPNAEQFPIIVSQDCGDEATKNAILSYDQQLTLIEQPDLSDIQVPPKEKKFKGYYKIARHYGWALNYTFSLGYEYVVIVEDDLNIAVDFYEYFLGTYFLLNQDPTLWCISAWNDNGKIKLIDTSHPELLYRTDFFPGLGWMLTKHLWQELSVKWPKSFWDDWIRHPEQRKSRACIRPEISRTRTFGKVGVSNGLFFDKYLRHIKLSEQYVPFTKMNLTYLLKENYDKTFLKNVYSLPIITYDELRRKLINHGGPVRIQYNTHDQYKRITKMLGLMDDFKSGVPRTAYYGIVSFFYEKRRVFLAPNVNWKGYDLSWS